MKSSRFWVVILILVATLTMLHLRGSVDRVPSSEVLSLLPQTIGMWAGQDVPIDKDTLLVLGDGHFLNRIYTASTTSGQPISAPVNLFIGYFPTQRTGQAIHSPQNCLPGAGWTFASAQTISLQRAHRKDYEVGEYLITSGSTKQVVLYWYLAHGRSIANDYLAKAYMMADAIRWNRTDGALIRVVTPLQPDESVQNAQERVINFADHMVPLLPRFIPD
jgi:EpsI family protein